MNNSLKDKVVVVTGASEGIGYAIVDCYLEEGAKIVILLDINETVGKKSTQTFTKKYGENKAVFMKCDVTKDLEDTSKNIFDTYKKVDVLVNNAGIVNEKALRKVVELNCISLMEWSMKFWEHMRKDKGGHGGTIINVASIYGYTVDPYLVIYKTTKFAAMGFTRTLGHPENFKRYGVRVIALCPGFTTTTLTSKQLCWDEQVPDFDHYVAKQQWQTIDEVGKASVEMFKVAESGSAWKIVGAVLAEIRLVKEGEHQR